MALSVDLANKLKRVVGDQSVLLVNPLLREQRQLAVLTQEAANRCFVALPVSLHARARIAATSISTYKVFYLRTQSSMELPILRFQDPSAPDEQVFPSGIWKTWPHARAPHHGHWPAWDPTPTCLSLQLRASAVQICFFRAAPLTRRGAE